MVIVGLFFSLLLQSSFGISELSAKVSEAADSYNLIQLVITAEPVRLQIPFKTFQESGRILLFPVRLVFVQDDRMLCMFPGSVNPHVTFRLGPLSGFMKNLYLRFISIQVSV